MYIDMQQGMKMYKCYTKIDELRPYKLHRSVYSFENVILAFKYLTRSSDLQLYSGIIKSYR